MLIAFGNNPMFKIVKIRHDIRQTDRRQHPWRTIVPIVTIAGFIPIVGGPVLEKFGKKAFNDPELLGGLFQLSVWFLEEMVAVKPAHPDLTIVTKFREGVNDFLQRKLDKDWQKYRSIDSNIKATLCSKQNHIYKYNFSTSCACFLMSSKILRKSAILSIFVSSISLTCFTYTSISSMLRARGEPERNGQQRNGQPST